MHRMRAMRPKNREMSGKLSGRGSNQGCWLFWSVHNISLFTAELQMKLRCVTGSFLLWRLSRKIGNFMPTPGDWFPCEKEDVVVVTGEAGVCLCLE